MAEAVGAQAVISDFGQFREKGRIGRTMGVMAGGPFLEKLKHVKDVEAGEGGAAALAWAIRQPIPSKSYSPRRGILSGLRWLMPCSG